MTFKTKQVFQTNFFRMFSRLTLRSVRTNLIAPPIQVYGVSGSYASAAYSAAVKAGEQVWKLWNTRKI